VIVAHQKILAALHVAEKLGVPHVRALTVPMLTPAREFPLPAMVRRDLGAFLNRASYRLVDRLTRPYAGLIRTWRRDTLCPRAPRQTASGRPGALLLQPQRRADTARLAAGGGGDRILAAPTLRFGGTA
jgi:hypothetical protein